MADSEGKNAESQGISLGIKWIKKYRPDIRLLVSYSGRKEGNYGYIYQATNWEYLGYFISPGFWLVDGEERHQVTLWYRHTKSNPSLPFKKDLCQMYSDVRQTWTKQFIYVMRLDKKLTLASPALPYPKPSTEYPIMTREEIYQRNDEVFNNYSLKRRDPVFYYYEKEQYLFTKRTLKKHGENFIEPQKYIYAQYDIYGELEKTAPSMRQLAGGEIKDGGISDAIRLNKTYKNKYFKKYLESEEVLEEVDVPIICIIDEIPFPRVIDIAEYLNVSRQAVSKAKVNNKNLINGHEVIWINETT